jgi:hypothetical protein
MADNLTDYAEGILLDWLNPAVAAPTRPTGPLKLRLMTANGTDSAAGTEVAGGSYAAQTIILGAAAGGSQSNTNLIEYPGMPACTVVGAEIWDSAGSPQRLWKGALTSSQIVNAGNTFRVQIGQLSVSLS